MVGQGDLIIGETTLERVLTQPDVTRLKEIRRLISRDPLSMERLPVEILKEEAARSKYPLLNISFLEMSNEIEYRRRRISVPKFSVYPIENNSFSMNVQNKGFEVPHIVYTLAGGVIGGAVGGIMVAGLGNAWVGIVVGTGIGAFSSQYIFLPIFSNEERFNGYCIKIEFPNLPDIFTQHLIRSTEFSEFSEPKKTNKKYGFKSRELTEDLKEKYWGIGGITLTSHLNGLIPAETRDRIEEALTVFPKNRLYLIAETRPDEWNVDKLIKCPVVVGVADERCFYIDKFDATSLEGYVSSEFLT